MVFAYCTNRPFVHKIHKQEGITYHCCMLLLRVIVRLMAQMLTELQKKHLIAGKNNTSCYISLCIIDTCLLTILSINMTSLERVSTIRGNEKESVREYNFSQNTDGRDAATACLLYECEGSKKIKQTCYYTTTKKRPKPRKTMP